LINIKKHSKDINSQATKYYKELLKPTYITHSQMPEIMKMKLLPFFNECNADVKNVK